jgi:flagellar biosynthesis protein FliR
MTAILQESVFIGVLILCRIGSCMMLLPGFGSTRVPMRIRLLLAVAVSIAFFPMLYQPALSVAREVSAVSQPVLLVNEIINGVMFGLLARLYMIGLQFAATVLTNSIGLAPTPGAPLDDTEAAPPLVSFISLCGTIFIFATNLHLVMLRALLDSYDVVKIGAPLDVSWHIDQLLAGLEKTSMLGLRLSGPYIIYSIIANLAIGFVNKFTPQISVYFVTTGMVAAGGLFLVYFTIDDWLSLFRQDFISFLD